MEVRDKIYIDGAWVPSSGQGKLEVFDSNTEEVIGSIPEGTAEDVNKAVAAAHAAFSEWSAVSREGGPSCSPGCRRDWLPGRRNSRRPSPRRWACR